METATRVADPAVAAVPPTSDTVHVPRTLTVTATFILSEEGRKAALLEGRDGKALQSVRLDVPASRLHLVSVDRAGVARLRLRPRFERDDEDRVRRIDAEPVYDIPPTVDDLFRAAARNHELEVVFHASKQSAAEGRLDAERSDRLKAAEAFMADREARAVPHPPPTPRVCVLVTPHGRFRFDVRTDVGLAKDVPAEAHRRFRADQRAKQEKNRADRAVQLALHEEKKRFVATWIAKHGTDEQRERQAAGVLPMAEAVEAITDETFAALASRPRYVLDGADRLRRAMRGADAAAFDPVRLHVRSEDTQTATAEQFALVREIQALVPTASVALRRHRITLAEHAPALAVVTFGVLVSQQLGVFLLRREFAAADA